MALTSSNIFTTGTPAPDFSLLDTVSGHYRSLQELKGEKGTLIMFICNHCPYVQHTNSELIRLAQDYSKQGIGFIAISSNDVQAYPQDGPEQMAETAKSLGYPFPYLYDDTQDIAKFYDAACTPDFYLFDSELKSIYHGQLDDSRPNSGLPSDGADIRAALDALLAGAPAQDQQLPSVGCNIKWRN